MTKAELRGAVRQIMQDTKEPYRWSEAEVAEHLQGAFRRLHSVRPSTRYVDGLLTDGVDLGEFGEDDALPVEGRYREALALYAAYLCYLDDATDTVNAERANACLARAEGLMVQ